MVKTLQSAYMLLAADARIRISIYYPFSRSQWARNGINSCQLSNKCQWHVARVAHAPRITHFTFLFFSVWILWIRCEMNKRLFALASHVKNTRQIIRNFVHKYFSFKRVESGNDSPDCSRPARFRHECDRFTNRNAKYVDSLTFIFIGIFRYRLESFTKYT